MYKTNIAAKRKKQQKEKTRKGGRRKTNILSGKEQPRMTPSLTSWLWLKRKGPTTGVDDDDDGEVPCEAEGPEAADEESFLLILVLVPLALVAFTRTLARYCA